MPLLIPDLFTACEAGCLPLRGFCQTDRFSCGVSAGWSAIHLLTKPHKGQGNFRQFARDCAADPVWGTSTKRLTNALRKQGMKVGTRPLSWATVREMTALGRPMITSIAYKTYRHWVVIYGHSRSEVFYSGRILPGFSRTRMRWADFKKICEPTCLTISRGAPRLAQSLKQHP